MKRKTELKLHPEEPLLIELVKGEPHQTAAFESLRAEAQKLSPSHVRALQFQLAMQAEIIVPFP